MRFREFMGFGSFLLPFGRKLFRSNGGTPDGFLRVLLYHHIAPHDHERFYQQIAFAAKRYAFVDIHEFGEMVEGRRPIEGGNLLLTFDDGFKSGRTVAEAILNAFGIKAVFFLCPDFIGRAPRERQECFIAENIFDCQVCSDEIDAQLALMDWPDVEFLIDSGHAVGSHSRSHCRLSRVLNPDDLASEIIDSGDLLEKRLGIPIELFAYPFGDVGSVGSHVLSLAQKRYRFLFSGIRGNNCPGTHPMTLRRDAIALNDSLPYFRFILEGGLSPFYYVARNRIDRFARRS